jgi:transcriptional regulator with XRE-family HTH domain
MVPQIISNKTPDPPLSPGEIVGLRHRHGLSRAEFAKLTKLGEATLGRWERGTLKPNAAYDMYLRLLSFDENMRRLGLLPAPQSSGLRYVPEPPHHSSPQPARPDYID